MKLFLTIIFQLILISNCFSQVSEEWVRKVNGANNSFDAGISMAIDAAGNIVVTGYVTNPGTGKDILTIKYSPFGQIIWQSVFNGSTNRDDIGKYIAIDNSGNIYVCGTSDSLLANTDFITLKYNSAGVLQWSSRYFNISFNSTDEPRGIILDNTANIYITGTSTGNGTSNDIVILKYNTSGTQLWVVRYDSTQDEASGIALDASANVYVSGRSLLSGSMSFTLLKYNSSGSQLWKRNYSTPGIFEESSSGLALDNSGNVYVTGYTASGGDYLTIKYSTSGNELWVNQYNGTGNSTDQPISILTDNSDNIYVTGYSYGNGSQTDIATVKYSSAGNQIWVQRYNGTANSNDRPSSITKDISGNIYITGKSIGLPNNDNYVTMKYDSSGAIKWIRYYDGTAVSNDAASSVVTDNTGNIYVTGYSSELGTGNDMSTIKYSSSYHDIRVGPFINIPNQFLTNHSYTITTGLYNNSSITENNVPVNFFINSTLINSVNISPASGEYDTLTNIWDPSTPGIYELKYVSALLNDSNRSNDTVKLTVQVIDQPTQIGYYQFCRTGINVPISSFTTAFDSIVINVPNSVSVRDVNLTIQNLTHTWDALMDIYLVHLGTEDSLIIKRGGSGDNFINTILNDSALVPISSGTAPFTGSYRPESPLSKFIGLPLNGSWKIKIFNEGAGDTGNLTAWCLNIVYDYITSVSGNEITPEKFSLYQNYPNPFNPVTKIKFDISGSSAAQTLLSVYDMLGREVEVLVNKELSPGTYEVDFDGSKYASGIYYYSLKTYEFSDVKKMVLIK